MKTRRINHLPMVKTLPLLSLTTNLTELTANDPTSSLEDKEKKVDEGEGYYNKEVFKHHQKSVHHRFYISTSIGPNEKWYYPLLQCLNKATECDIITIYLNTPGGCVFTTTQIVSAINLTAAKVHLVVQGLCASGGTIIAFAANYETITVDPHTLFLFHIASMFSYGKINELHDTVGGMRKLIDTLYRDSFEQILTKDELNDVLVRDRELYLTGRDINVRLDALAEKVKQEEERKENRKKKTSSKTSK